MAICNSFSILCYSNFISKNEQTRGFLICLCIQFHIKVINWKGVFLCAESLLVKRENSELASSLKSRKRSKGEEKGSSASPIHYAVISSA